jgi:hypothetical protein
MHAFHTEFKICNFFIIQMAEDTVKPKYGCVSAFVQHRGTEPGDG